MKVDKLAYSMSFLFDKLIEKTSSKHNETLEVVLRNGIMTLNAKNANYSFDTLHHVFQYAFEVTKLKEKKISNVLILGYGAGSVASIICSELNLKCEIVGVEIDEKVIELAQKYFPSNQISKQLIISSAEDFMSKNELKFDLIVVDVFNDLEVPEEVQSKQFLNDIKRSLNENGMLYYNFVLNVSSKKEEKEKIHSNLSELFSNLEVLEVHGTNRVFYGF